MTLNQHVTNNDSAKPVNTLRALRALHPKRALNLTASKAVAAQQANRLRARHHALDDYCFDTTLIAEQPHIRIELDEYISMAGSTHWTGAHWQILLNADDTLTRRRFTLAHEYKHIIDHGTPVDPDIEEQICDHFAACLLMPKQKVLAAWTNPHLPQHIDALADLFGVSRQAMRYRLHDLGVLQRETQRCPMPRTRQPDTSSIHYRPPITQRAKVPT